VAAALFVADDLGAASPEAPPPAEAGARDEAGDDTNDQTDGDEPPDRGETPAPREGERARRRRLRDEIAELDRELVYLEPLGPAGKRPSLPAGRILTAAELEDVRDGLAARVDELRADRADARRRAQLPPEPEPARRPAPSVWRHAGVWTGPRPRTASFGA
jgi:hypothetical protein